MNNKKSKGLLIFSSLLASSFVLVFFPGKAYCVPPAQCVIATAPDLVSEVRGRRVAAMRSCLAALAVDVRTCMRTKYNVDVDRLYTYGASGKIANMKTLSRLELWDFTRGFQIRRETREAISRLGFGSKAVPTNVIDMAKRFYKDSYDLQNLLEAYQHAGKLKAVIIAYKIAAFAKIYPKFIESLDYNLKGIGGTKGWKDGEKKANEVDPSFDSTGGTGIYLSFSPVQTVKHITPNGSGLAINIPNGNLLINLDDPEVDAALVGARIIVPSLIHRQEDAFILRPTGKNLYISPLDFEEAVDGRFLIAFRSNTNRAPGDLPYIVDKGVLDFQRDADPVNVANFGDCNDFRKMLGTGFCNEPDAVGEELLRHLQAQGNFTGDLFVRWRTCAAVSAEKKKSFCDTLINEDLIGKYLAQDYVRNVLLGTGKAGFKDVLRFCGCTAVENADGKLSFNCPKLP